MRVFWIFLCLVGFCFYRRGCRGGYRSLVRLEEGLCEVQLPLAGSALLSEVLCESVEPLSGGLVEDCGPCGAPLGGSISSVSQAQPPSLCMFLGQMRLPVFSSCQLQPCPAGHTNPSGGQKRKNKHFSSLLA